MFTPMTKVLISTYVATYECLGHCFLPLSKVKNIMVFITNSNCTIHIFFLSFLVFPSSSFHCKFHVRKQEKEVLNLRGYCFPNCVILPYTDSFNQRHAISSVCIWTSFYHFWKNEKGNEYHLTKLILLFIVRIKSSHNSSGKNLLFINTRITKQPDRFKRKRPYISNADSLYILKQIKHEKKMLSLIINRNCCTLCS